MLLPWLVPNFVPLIVTVVPTAPLVGDRPVIAGAEITVKLMPLLAMPDRSRPHSPCWRRSAPSP